ncbi:MAG: exopolysaccharide biosynthesis polyprenyl glycosylphosphotransferase, partial [Clostridiales bacterium]|nr:exopolysaccharide biosynthesis polyprenyl glycosylphosphotransferase [Clostridiales bacterium]
MKQKEHARLYVQFIDIGCIILSFILAKLIRYGLGTIGGDPKIYLYMFIYFILSYFIICKIKDYHTGVFRRGFFDEFLSVFELNVSLALAVTGILFVLQIGSYYSRVFFVSFFLINIWITYIARQYFKIFLLGYYKKSGFSKKIMLITTSDQAFPILAKMRKERDWEIQVTKLAIIDQDMVGESISGIPVKANSENIYEVITRGVVDEVFIYAPMNKKIDIENILMQLKDIGVTVNVGISTFDLNVKEKMISRLGGYYVLSFSNKTFNQVELGIKRGIDVVGALVGLFITAVISIFIAPAILLESPGPLIFSQTRIGKNGRRFKIYKFRSMCVDAEEKKLELADQNEMTGLMFKISKDPRVTKVGKFIRKTSIDEFPQFFNVLRGDMSLVGTRPPTEDEFLQYKGRHK